MGANKGKPQYLGRHLMVKGEYAEKILKGSKTTTIRLGRVRTRYSEVIIHSGGRPIAKAMITSVRHKRVRDLTDEDARKDGFKSREELVRALKEAYGSIDPDSMVTIIEFRVSRRFDELETENPYMGLDPADIARLALRYLKGLNEEERRVLMDLTRTNSIRSTALRLYGDLGKRWIVRKVLRRALKALAGRGLLGRRTKSSTLN